MAAPNPVRASTCGMYAGIALMLLACAAPVVFRSDDTFAQAGRVFIFWLFGYAVLVVVSLPAALYSFISTSGPNRMQDSLAALAGRWLVLAGVVVPLLLWFGR